MRLHHFVIVRWVVAVLAISQAVTLVAEPNEAGKNIRTPTSPPIILDEAASGIFPESWLAAPIHAKAEPLDEKEKQRASDIVVRALAKYPAKVLRDHLKKVYVVGRLEYFGVATGGTNSRNAVYLAVTSKYPSDAIERVFHAEFSSILLRNRASDFDQTAWQRINPPEFSYRGNGVQAIKKSEASQKFQAALHQEGFLLEYGTSALENDFNSIADRLFKGDAVFWNVVDQYPKVRAKVVLAMAFLAKLDASFTEKFFRSFADSKQP